MNGGSIRELIKDWYANYAKNETEPFYQFIVLWICINAWMSFESNEINDAAMINELLNDKESIFIKSFINMSVTTTGNRALEDFKNLAPIGDNRGIKKDIIIESTKDTDQIIWGIYRIRCNLFHGSKQSNSRRDKELTTVAGHILKKWVSELMAIW